MTTKAIPRTVAVTTLTAAMSLTRQQLQQRVLKYKPFVVLNSWIELKSL